MCFRRGAFIHAVGETFNGIPRTSGVQVDGVLISERTFFSLSETKRQSRSEFGMARERAGCAQPRGQQLGHLMDRGVKSNVKINNDQQTFHFVTTPLTRRLHKKSFLMHYVLLKGFIILLKYPTSQFDMTAYWDKN